MFVFKLSWLPYILVIGGIYALSEGLILPGIVFTLLGGMWIYIKFDEKRSEKTTKSYNAGTVSKPVDSTAAKAAAAAPKAQETKPAGKFCRHCGAKVKPDDLYCVECGEKL